MERDSELDSALGWDPGKDGHSSDPSPPESPVGMLLPIPSVGGGGGVTRVPGFGERVPSIGRSSASFRSHRDRPLEIKEAADEPEAAMPNARAVPPDLVNSDAPTRALDQRRMLSGSSFLRLPSWGSGVPPPLDEPGAVAAEPLIVADEAPGPTGRDGAGARTMRERPAPPTERILSRNRSGGESRRGLLGLVRSDPAATPDGLEGTLEGNANDDLRLLAIMEQDAPTVGGVLPWPARPPGEVAGGRGSPAAFSSTPPPGAGRPAPLSTVSPEEGLLAAGTEMESALLMQALNDGAAGPGRALPKPAPTAAAAAGTAAAEVAAAGAPLEPAASNGDWSRERRSPTMVAMGPYGGGRDVSVYGLPSLPPLLRPPRGGDTGAVPVHPLRPPGSRALPPNMAPGGIRARRRTANSENSDSHGSLDGGVSPSGRPVSGSLYRDAQIRNAACVRATPESGGTFLTRRSASATDQAQTATRLQTPPGLPSLQIPAGYIATRGGLSSGEAEPGSGRGTTSIFNSGSRPSYVGSVDSRESLKRASISYDDRGDEFGDESDRDRVKTPRGLAASDVADSLGSRLGVLGLGFGVPSPLGRRGGGGRPLSTSAFPDDPVAHPFSGLGQKEGPAVPQPGGRKSKHNHMWTTAETETFIDLVDTHGVGSWSKVAEACRGIPGLETRLPVDFKDRWRNLTRIIAKGGDHRGETERALPRDLLERIAALAARSEIEAAAKKQRREAEGTTRRRMSGRRRKPPLKDGGGAVGGAPGSMRGAVAGCGESAGASGGIPM